MGIFFTHRFELITPSAVYPKIKDIIMQVQDHTKLEINYTFGERRLDLEGERVAYDHSITSPQLPLERCEVFTINVNPGTIFMPRVSLNNGYLFHSFFARLSQIGMELGGYRTEYIEEIGHTDHYRKLQICTHQDLAELYEKLYFDPAVLEYVKYPYEVAKNMEGYNQVYPRS